MNQGTDEERMGQRYVARRSPALGALLGLLGLLLLARPAAAQEVAIEVAGPDRAEIAEAVRQELSRPGHRPGTVVVHTDPRASTLRVVFTPEGGAPPVERTVPLPSAPRERARVAAFLARNLASDEADELLRELQARPEVAPRPVELPTEPPQAAPPAEPAPGVTARDVAAPVTVVAPSVKEPCASGAPEVPLALSLFSPLGLPSTPARANVAYGALYGDLAEIRGVGTGLVLRVRCDSRGVVTPWLGSVVQGRSLGLLVAGGFNVTTGQAGGVALSGGLNVHTGPVQGLTASPVTVATGGLEGAQIGIINIGGSVTGAQVGVLNIGTAVRGAQVGVVNIAGPVTGAQVGVLNVAKEVDAAVGALASISWAHRVRAVAWISSVSPLQVGVQFEGKRMYAGISFGRLFEQILTEGDFYLGAEIGLHAYANPEHGVIWDFAVSTDSSVGVGAGKLVDLVRLGTRFGYRVAPRFAPYVYGGVAVVSPPAESGAPKDEQDFEPEIGAGAIF